MIKKTLIEANRYEDVINILKDIIFKLDDISYQVDAFIDNDNVTKWYVDGKLVKEEAFTLLRCIIEDCDINIVLTIVLSNLCQYVKSETDMMLHNYAVHVSHRKEPYTDIDDIRVWEILQNLIDCLYMGYDEDGNWYWNIPNGWKKSYISE